MALSARLLVSGEESLVDTFLAPHTPFAFFMRSNLKKGGLFFEGKSYQAEYFGAFNAENLEGILMHGWMGGVQIFASNLAVIPTLAGAWRANLAQKPRKIEIFLGPADQIKTLLSSVGISLMSLRKGGPEEGLFTLSLKDMIMPPLLQKAGITVRRAGEGNIGQLITWRHDYFVEALGALPGQETYNIAKTEIIRRVREGDYFVLEDQGTVVSFCGVGGFLPDWTNVGPLWTPPEKRNKGYGRAAAAGALSVLEKEGLANAVLFAIRADAQKAYGAIGFKHIGSWIFDFLIKPVDRL
jgi:uncharacterized protein